MNEAHQLEIALLAALDVLASLTEHRRNQVWEAVALWTPQQQLRDAPMLEAECDL